MIENPPFISYGTLNNTYYKPLLDTLKISAIETNPDNHISKTIAKLLTSSDSLITEIELSQKDSAFYGSLVLNSTEEEFYNIQLQQNGIDIPSKLFYNNLRFTTAGPVMLDSISYRKGLLNYHYVRPYLHNLGNEKTITNATIRLICNDPWIASIGIADVTMPNISPNSSVGIKSWITLAVHDSIFPGYFNFRAEIKNNGWTYWTDSTQMVITDVEENLQQPLTFKLEQNYPNPFNPQPVTTIAIQHSASRQGEEVKS